MKVATAHTFAHPLLRAYLGAVLHRVQREVDLRDLSLILHRANGTVNVRILVGALAVHGGGVDFSVTESRCAVVVSGAFPNSKANSTQLWRS